MRIEFTSFLEKVSLTTILFALVFFIGCKKEIALDVEEQKNSILEVMKMQEQAWSDGDVHQFMQGYWKSDSLSFIGSRGLSMGWTTTLENYKKGYPTKDDMGSLRFDVLKLEPLSDDKYFMIGRYNLTRINDAPSGYFSLIWHKVNGQWVIISDHTSAS